MSNPISINFGFENCDYAEVPIDFVYSFSVGDITTSRSFYPNNQGMKDYTVAGTLYVHFKDSFVKFSGKTQFDSELGIVRLTKYNDICWFGIKYEDGSEDIYQVKWKGDDQYTNKGQRSEDYGHGLVILVNIDEEVK